MTVGQVSLAAGRAAEHLGRCPTRPLEAAGRRSAPVAPRDPTFHEFASDWFEAQRREWRVKPDDPDLFVFATATGRPHNPSNVRERVLDRAIVRANDWLQKRGEVPLPAGLSPHKLCHTYASLLVPPKPERGLEPLTLRLQGECSTS